MAMVCLNSLPVRVVFVLLYCNVPPASAAVGAATSKGGVALQRADRLSRKLQRRITRRTLLEAQALRKDTETTVHTLAFFAETVS